MHLHFMIVSFLHTQLTLVSVTLFLPLTFDLIIEIHVLLSFFDVSLQKTCNAKINLKANDL